ncbi:hypothetical protein ACS0TY_018758 [Phlomoides rotata]
MVVLSLRGENEFVIEDNDVLEADENAPYHKLLLLAERGSNLVVINPGSANVRIGLAQHDAPVSVPHCISRHTSQLPNMNVQDQLLNSQVTTSQHIEHERAYDIIASLLKIRCLDEEVTDNQYSQKMGRVDAFPPQSNNKKENIIQWTHVFENPSSPTEEEQ